MKRCFCLALLLSGFIGLTACNTVEGFGEDLQAVGGKMSDKAEREKNE